MPCVTFVLPDSTRQVVVIPAGQTVMEGARAHGIPGIVAECGGACACATCHVYVDPGWVDRLPPRATIETDMLDFARDPDQLRSRLTCQLKVVDEYDGLVVTIRPSQD